jgi:hypothetical protein
MNRRTFRLGASKDAIRGDRPHDLIPACADISIPALAPKSNSAVSHVRLSSTKGQAV